MIEFDKLAVGDSLPDLDIPITARLIVSGAIASQDFEDVHHDKAAANAKGTPDIFMNILTTNGLVGRYITDWCGQQCSVNRIQLRLGAPNYPGDTMRMRGEIASIGDDQVEVSFKGSNSMGNHVTGTAYLAILDTSS